jgi:NADH dehydrogenase
MLNIYLSSFPIDYDYLVLCPGSETQFYGVPGAQEHSFQLKRVEDVEAIHRGIQQCIRKAMDAGDEQVAKQALAFVGVGGGAAGIEAFAAIQRYVTKALQASAPELLSFPSYTLIQGGPQILPGFHANTVKGGMRSLEKLGIQVQLGDPASQVSNSFLLTKTGQRFDAALVLWCGGIKPVEIAMNPDIHREPNGCLLTDPGLCFTDSIFAAGDIINYRQKNVLIPKNAQTALRMARCIKDNILATIEQKPLKRFRYSALGSLIVVGDDGYLELPMSITVPSKLIKNLREFFYRMRFKQICGS